MDSEEEYLVAKSIVKSQTDEQWNLIRVDPGVWENEEWMQFRNYSVQDLKHEMSAYKQIIRGEILRPYSSHNLCEFGISFLYLFKYLKLVVQLKLIALLQPLPRT